MKLDLKTIIIMAGVALLALALVLGFTPNFTGLNTYQRSGWEISTEIVGLKCNNLAPDRVPYVIPDIGDTDPSIFKRRGVMVQHDFDDRLYGMPDIVAEVGDIREEIPVMPYQSLEQDYEGYKYVIDYHEYLFDVQVKTKANAEVGTPPSSSFGKSLYWYHETSMPYSVSTNIVGAGGNHVGEAFDGGVYVRFSNLPFGFPDFGPAPEDYEFNGYWLGIMNAKIHSHARGQNDPDLDATHKGWAKLVADDGAQLNMYQDDGALAMAYADVPWDMSKVLDPDIQNVIIVYLPFELFAGAWEKYDQWYTSLLGSIIECKPVDYYIRYTVRMECLVVKEYAHRDPNIPPNPSPIEPPDDYVPYTPYSFWDKYGLYIIAFVVIAVIALIIISWFSGIGMFGLISMLWGGRR